MKLLPLRSYHRSTSFCQDCVVYQATMCRRKRNSAVDVPSGADYDHFTRRGKFAVGSAILVRPRDESSDDVAASRVTKRCFVE
jgi:hypothetical protein